ncbi:hypothetical protein EVAR_36949_1 [Eumeta japonica]|uniref:Uncharacterized protein n=1 Tax=Eumeta variegata TaxID=151549 RepID=A0A4C1W6X9_EUMVA|nr:hypothetical protein EVAR_36949_1 [Eumeta japonica]
MSKKRENSLTTSRSLKPPLGPVTKRGILKTPPPPVNGSRSVGMFLYITTRPDSGARQKLSGRPQFTRTAKFPRAAVFKGESGRKRVSPLVIRALHS